MAHYVIRVEGSPERMDGGSQVHLSVTSDDGAHQRGAWARVEGPEPDADGWGAAVFYAVEQIEFGFKGQTWGVEIEDVEPLIVDVTEATLGHLTEDSTARASVVVGGVVGEFEL
jgi:hypothetical protein